MTQAQNRMEGLDRHAEGTWQNVHTEEVRSLQAAEPLEAAASRRHEIDSAIKQRARDKKRQARKVDRQFTPQAASGGAPPGWWRDPNGSGNRYWDGGGWTDSTAP